MEKLISKLDSLLAADKPLVVDAVLFSAILALCFLSFNHPDILHTIACATAVLNGHLLDFYEVVAAVLSPSNYLPSTYIVFSLWGLPLKLLGYFKTVAYADPVWLLFWFKVLTSAFFAGSAVVIYKLCLDFSKDRARALLACVIWVSSPVAVFSQFVFGQYDIISVFFMLLGLLYYVRGNLLLFAFWFSISVGFKYFPAFVFFPLLLSKEKNLKRLFLYSLVFAAPNLIQISLFLHSEAFATGVLGFGAAKRALNTGLILWAALCVYSYLSNYRTRAERDLYFSAKLGLFSLLLIFSHIKPWHPQWLLIFTPFIAILLAFASNIKALLLADTIFSLAFFSHTFRTYPAAVDTNLFSLGIWSFLTPAFAAVQDVWRLSSVGLYTLGSKKNLFHVIISSLLLLVFASRMRGAKQESKGETSGLTFALIRLRFYGVIGLFLVSAFYAYRRSLAL